MAEYSPEFDAYIAGSADFARPILEKIRKLFHRACPEIEETMKWGFPHFEYKGIVGSMAAFKQHASFGFWKGKLLKDPYGLFTAMENAAMSGAKVTDISELPADKILLEYILQAVALNEAGIKLPARKKRTHPKAVEVPDYFKKALKQNRKALATFEAFSPSHKREYVEWITEAKQQATRDRRMATAIQWLSEGKPHNWKYTKKK